MMDAEFWISNKNTKEGVGVKIIPVYADTVIEIESIIIQAIDHNHNDAIKNEIEIFKIGFSKLFQFAESLKKEADQ